MANNEETPLGQGYEEIIRDNSLDNTNQQLNRHVYNRSGKIDHEMTDFILKRADYTNTFIAIDTAGLPNNATLYLVDEDSNQLYSPVDANGNWVTTRCSITVGENDIIPLPAQFTANLASHIPFPAGTYDWKLQYPEDDYFLEEEIPLRVEIRDFKVWDILTPQIYPNEDIKIKLKTYGDTLYPILTGNIHDLAYVLTSNATFDVDTGIITYPISDINDVTIGKHMQIINQENECTVDYEIKNPFEIRLVNTPREYSTNNQTILLASFQNVYRESDNRYVNAVETNPDIYVNGSSLSALTNLGHSQGKGKIYTGIKFPPGTYNIEATAKYLPNHLYYTATKTMIVTTENCSITLTLNYNENSYTNVNSYQPVILQNINSVNSAQNYSYSPQNGILDASGTNAHNLQSTDIYIDLASFNGEYMLIQCLSEGVKFIAHDKGTNEATANFHELGVFEYLQQYNISIDNNIATINKNNTDENIIIDLTAQEFGFIFPSTDNLYVKILQGEKTTSSLIATYLHNETPIPNATVYIKELNNDTIIYTNQTDINGQIQLDWSTGRYQAIVQDNYTNEDLLYSNIIDTENPYLNNITISNSDLITTYGFNTPIDEISINNHGDLILTLDGEVNNIISNVYIGENGELYYRSE